VRIRVNAGNHYSLTKKLKTLTVKKTNAVKILESINIH
jgi:hypothetical protein